MAVASAQQRARAAGRSAAGAQRRRRLGRQPGAGLAAAVAVARAQRTVREVPWLWGLGGALAGLVLALLLFAPATWLAAGLAQASDGQVQLADARGTIWNGSAQLVLTGGAGSKDAAPLPGRLDWQLRPRWNGLAAQVRAGCCMEKPAALRVRWRF